MKTDTKKIVDDFFKITTNFLQKKISISTFEDKYIDFWYIYVDSENQTEIPTNIKTAINRIFTTLDVYNPDPKLRDEYEIDEKQLRLEVKEQLLKVKPELEI